MSLFPHYPADPGTVEGAGDRAVESDADMREVGDTLQSQAQRASSESSGLLPAPLATSADPARDKLYGAAAAALVAGGSMRLFARSVREYNTGVDELNTEWEQAQSTSFGVSRSSVVSDDMTDSEADTAFDDAVGSARAALRRDLEARETVLKDELDAAGDDAASLLQEGANPETLAYLGFSGVLPPGAIVAQLGLSLAEAQRMFDAGKALARIPKSGRALREAFHMLKGTDIREALRLIEQDWDELLDRSKWVGTNPLKTWIQDHSDHLARSTQWMDDAAAARWQRLANLVDDGKWFGRALAPLGVIGGGLQLWDTFENWDELSTKDRTLNTVGGASSMVAGGGTILAMAVGVNAIPVAGQVIFVAAGVIATGVAIYQNWDAITDFAGDVGGAVKDFVTDPGETLSNVADGAGDLLDSAGDALSGAAGGVKDFFGF